MTDLHDDERGVRRTDEYCATNPQAGVIRRTLLTLEKRAHRTGWDGPDSRPRLFQLDAHRDRPRVRTHWARPFTTMLETVCAGNGGNVGAGMRALAEHSEATSELIRTGVPPGDWGLRLTPEALAGLTEANEWYRKLRAAMVAGQDLAGPIHGDPAYRFHGYGFRAETWFAVADSDDVRRLAEAHQLDRYEHAREARVVYYMGRDGVLWFVVRHRGHRPSAVMYLPESDDPHVGLIAHGLSRMVNAGVNNPGPIWPDDHPDRPRAGERHEN